MTITRRVESLYWQLMQDIDDARTDIGVGIDDIVFRATVKDYLGREVWEAYKEWIEDEG